MPKVLIREYDNSTTGFPATDNFAVVVPGHFGTPRKTGEKDEDGTDIYYDPKDRLIDYDVYELRSQTDFVNYIGRRAGAKAVEGVGPTIEVVNEPKETNSYNGYTQYLCSITPADIAESLSDEGAYLIYRVTELPSTNQDFGKNGKLLKTITYNEKVIDEDNSIDNNGDGDYTDEGDVLRYKETIQGQSGYNKTVTIKLAPLDIEALNTIGWVADGASSFISAPGELFCRIKKSNGIVNENEGTNAIPDAHIGNQIAYELLGLGYTVLFKKMTPMKVMRADGTEDDVDNNALLLEPTFWEPLKDKSVFNFRYVMTGGFYNAGAMTQICNLADFRNNTKLEDAETLDNRSGRGDCIALCDIDEDIENYGVSDGLPMSKVIRNIGYAAKAITANEYSAIFAPKVRYVMTDEAVKDFGGNKTFPASFHYLACAARAFDRYNEWYAVAGYTRGISNYSIETTSVKLGEIAINTLAPRTRNDYTAKAINLILHERGNYYLWGNRTGYALDNKGLVFHHFLNIRQLCCSIKKQLYTACRQFTFDPNSDLLWINFVNAIKPTLEAMRADQGIKGYTITKVANNKKALLTARIRIVPIEAVEDFDISIYLEDSLTGIVVTADETQA